ncbi:Hsp70 family protein [Roseibacillus ishigakijimensis]|uniref:Hsp70 family protein n=1 Tax=Roseibacillus ishigakijimensis TaxID=454146 RepID=A0A934VME8_9BACT|nr:Hsp70 family protein [Roseibacillus ishigakijimensis]MBK1834016.1 Hsp70 family protein [Roseibacillus ishigakijimensis]
MEQETIIGIDLGTTNSTVGVVESGFPILLADEDGNRLTPSAVWRGADGRVSVGWPARRRRGLGGVITSIKRAMGTSGLVEGFSPEEISAEILRRLKGIAEARLERPVHKAVITVPAYFNESQRGATQRAGELAGLEVVRLLSEPTAAALAYGLDKLGEEKRVAVYDLGGGTFDVSLLELREGQFEVLATAGDTRLGGDDFDHLLAKATGLELSELSGNDLARVLAEAERVKLALSEEEEAAFLLPFLGQESVEHEVSRKEFARLIEPLLKRTEACCRRALSDAGLFSSQIDAVVLAGGSTRVPAVRENVEAIFGRPVEEGVDPDESVGLGAAIQAGIISGAVREVVLLDVTPLSLGLETMGGLMNVLIPRNTTIPCKAGEMFTNAADGQRSMRIRILQGERELAKDNWELGQIEVPFEPVAKGQARVGVQFSLNASGLLEVLARDTTTGKDTILQIESSAIDVADARVEKMVSESVDHAFADMDARVFVEAKLKAEELLGALEPALQEIGEALPAEDLSAVLAAEKEVRSCLAEEGQGARLKAAVEKLDQATEQLAALVVERAMAGR